MDLDRRRKITKYLLGIKRGDIECLNFLYDDIAKNVRHIALSYFPDENEADDFIQDFWADIGKIAQKFRFSKNGYGFLYKVLNRRALNRLKALKRERRRVNIFVDYESYEEPTDNIQLIEVRETVKQAMSILTNHEKEIVQLHYFEELSLKEISKVIGKSTTQTFNIKQSALDKMRRFLEEDEKGI